MSEPTTIISEQTSVHGNLQGDEDLTVLGQVEGSIQLDHTLIVDTNGIVKADIAVRNAVISGVVIGNMKATESIHITEDGRMVGDIAAPRIIIVDGAMFRGRVDMGEGSDEAPQPPPSAAKTREKIPAREKEKPPARGRPLSRPRSAPWPSSPRSQPKEIGESAVEKEEEPPALEEQEEEGQSQAGGEAPSPRPRVPAKKRRVAVRKKR